MASIKLKASVFNELIKGLTDRELSKMMGISTTQLWRVRLPDNDPRHNDPGIDFIAGALRAFPDKAFEDLFFLDKSLRARNEYIQEQRELVYEARTRPPNKNLSSSNGLPEGQHRRLYAH